MLTLIKCLVEEVPLAPCTFRVMRSVVNISSPQVVIVMAIKDGGFGGASPGITRGPGACRIYRPSLSALQNPCIRPTACCPAPSNTNTTTQIAARTTQPRWPPKPTAKNYPPFFSTTISTMSYSTVSSCSWRVSLTKTTQTRSRMQRWRWMTAGSRIWER